MLLCRTECVTNAEQLSTEMFEGMYSQYKYILKRRLVSTKLSLVFMHDATKGSKIIFERCLSPTLTKPMVHQ